MGAFKNLFLQKQSQLLGESFLLILCRRNFSCCTSIQRRRNISQFCIVRDKTRNFLITILLLIFFFFSICKTLLIELEEEMLSLKSPNQDMIQGTSFCGVFRERLHFLKITGVCCINKIEMPKPTV